MTATARRHLAAVDTVTDEPASRRARTIERFQIRYEVKTSERTAEVYAWAARRLDSWLTARNDPRDFTELEADDIEDFLSDFARGRNGFSAHKPSYTHQMYRSLRIFFGWLEKRYEAPSPVREVEQPRLGERRIENKVLSDEQIRAILFTVAHNHRDITAVRDHAMLRMLLTGMRRGELIGLTVDDAATAVRSREIRVQGKGDAQGPRVRYVPFGKETLLALMDYLEAREKHPLAHRKELWLGRRGVITGRGFHTIVKKRAEQAGIPGVHPHMFRHTNAHRWLADGGSETDLMELHGWKTRDMLDVYAKSTRAERAKKAWRDRALDDRI